MPGRTSFSYKYRFGFNGMENATDIAEGNYTTPFRELDTRLGGRWWSKDPIVKPWESPYAGFSNNPIVFSDPSGLDPGTGDDTNGGKGPKNPYHGKGGPVPNKPKTDETPEEDDYASANDGDLNTNGGVYHCDKYDASKDGWIYPIDEVVVVREKSTKSQPSTAQIFSSEVDQGDIYIKPENRVVIKGCNGNCNGYPGYFDDLSESISEFTKITTDNFNFNASHTTEIGMGVSERFRVFGVNLSEKGWKSGIFMEVQTNEFILTKNSLQFISIHNGVFFKNASFQFQKDFANSSYGFKAGYNTYTKDEVILLNGSYSIFTFEGGINGGTVATAGISLFEGSWDTGLHKNGLKLYQNVEVNANADLVGLFKAYRKYFSR